MVQTDGYNAPTPAILRAYNATNLTTELYDSNQNAARDGAGNATKFVVPTIANGKVYIASAGNIHVYGLLAGAPTAAVPVISPASQTFTNSISVTITDSTPGATIYYTTDGTVPTTSSTVYSGPITVTTTKTITAIASASGFVQSAPASQTYTAQNQVAAPTFSPPGGTIRIADFRDAVGFYAGSKHLLHNERNDSDDGVCAVFDADTREFNDHN